MTAPKSSKKLKRSYQKHGLETLKRAVKELGARAIDPRTRLGRARKKYREDLTNDLGGEANISIQTREIVNLIVTTKLILDSITTWLLQQPSIVNRRNKCLYPVVLQRQTLADSLARLLEKVGLERRGKPLLDLGSYIELKAKEAADEKRNEKQ